MSNKLQKNLIERVKDFLQIDGEHSLFELTELLREFRNNLHPDRFQDKEIKVKAEERFKDAQTLLDECQKIMELEHFNLKPMELAIYKPIYDAEQLKGELYKTKKELEDAKAELTSERKRNDSLTKDLQQKKDESLNVEIEHLQSIYRPSTRKYASFGIAIILSGALGVMSQMEKVSNILAKYSPFPNEFVSSALFFCMMFFLVAMLRKLWERKYIKRKSEEVCSPKCAGDFMKHLEQTRPSSTSITEFSEVEAFDFISRDNLILRFLLTYHFFGRETVNGLKDIFIHSLLNKKLIEFSKAENMQRYFKVSNTKDNNYWYEAWRAEKVKNDAHSNSTEA